MVARRDWPGVARVCVGERWESHARLGAAHHALGAGQAVEARDQALALLGTAVDLDAAYLAGYLLAGRGKDEAEKAKGRALLMHALVGYQEARRNGDASRAAGILSRSPRPEHRFDDELAMAELAVNEAELSGDRKLRGQAVRTLAEAYDAIGMAGPAREAFMTAEDLSSAWPEDLAFAYFNHALLLFDRGSLDSLRAELPISLEFLDAAAEQVAKATAAGLGTRVATLEVAIHLNRALALSQLGQVVEAETELAAIPPDERSRSRVMLVRGYVAAKRGDLAAATAAFEGADEDGSLDNDYRWNVALEIALLHRAAGDLRAAEEKLRAAVDIIEAMRSAARKIELRPWVLQRRTAPYHELIDLLVAQDRDVDALAVAEALHARVWLDVTLGRSAAREPTLDEALRDARVSARPPSWQPPSGPELLAALGDQEALVFVTAGDHVWRAHVAGGKVAFARLPPGALQVIDRFRGKPDDAELGVLAAAALLPPDLSDAATPLVVVGRPAADVQLAALPWRGAPLVMARPIAILPGLAAQSCGARTWSGGTVVMGDVLGDLGHAGEEARRVAARHGVTALTGAQATLAALAQARDARLLHLALHGRPAAGGTALELADSRVTAAHILELGLAPAEVLLTGCNTAAAPDAESWGGFPSAFLANGSRFVISTTRSVEDAAAARVSAAYHDQPAGLDPVQRLAAAQRQLAGTMPASQWGSFSAWGSPSCPAGSN
jgi:hypothetical protein